MPDGDEDDAALPALLEAEFAVWDDPGVDWDAYDVVVVRSTWDYQERRDDFVAWARRVGDRLVNPPDVIAWNTDKRYLAELEAAGLPVVHTQLVTPGAPFADPGGEYVVKPTVSAGSRHTARFAAGEHDRAAALVRDIHATDRTAMVQPYVASVDERGETALLFFDGAFSHAIRKGPILRPGADPVADVLFAEEEIRPRDPSSGELAVGERVAGWVAERFGGPLAYARVDVVEDAAGAPVVLEVELAEPSLFFAHAEGSAERYAAAVLRRLTGRRPDRTR
jgi:glutathione synthase/RimK-type ligase-like ATP-grasp enzyme